MNLGRFWLLDVEEGIHAGSFNCWDSSVTRHSGVIESSLGNWNFLLNSLIHLPSEFKILEVLDGQHGEGITLSYSIHWRYMNRLLGKIAKGRRLLEKDPNLSQATHFLK